MPYLHPSLRPPPQELDLSRRHMLRSNHSRRAVIVRHVFVGNQVLLTELLRHRGARVRCRMLNVRPVDILPGELEIRLDRFARVVRIADDQAADDEQAVSMEVLDGLDGGIAPATPVSSTGIIRPCLEEIEVAFENVLDAE